MLLSLLVLGIRVILHPAAQKQSTVSTEGFEANWMAESANMNASASNIRAVAKVIKGQKMMEGAGVRICRTIGAMGVRVDPYLMLDELKLPASEATAGFPDHPHRGFETCTIMLSGKMEHRDSVGNHGVVGPGGVQWMTAGRGIVHSEMPAVTEGDLHGFQLWINLPATDKMVKPRYQDIDPQDIPTVGTPSGSSIRVMAGKVANTTGPISLRNPGMLLDVRLDAEAEWHHEIPAEWNAFAYVYAGSGKICDTNSDVQHAYVFSRDGDRISAQADSEGLRFLLIAGRPIDEPIVQYGPFVMNTQEEIMQAFRDFQSGKLQNPSDDVWADWHDEDELR